MYMNVSAQAHFRITTEMICTCLGWSWCRTPDHCVRRGSLTRWPSSHPWSSPAHRLTLCQSGSSLEREKRGKTRRGGKKWFMLWEVRITSSEVVSQSSGVTLIHYLLQTWPCGAFSVWRSTPVLWSQRSLLQSGWSHLWSPLQSDPAEQKGGNN